MTPPPHKGTQVTTVWAHCPTDLYPEPSATATQFYSTLVLLAVLVIALWFVFRRATRRHG